MNNEREIECNKHTLTFLHVYEIDVIFELKIYIQLSVKRETYKLDSFLASTLIQQFGEFKS